MGWWLVNADTLAGSRFVVSPLAEVTSSLKTLERGTAAHPGERGWLDVHLPAYRERLADDPVTALLVRAGLGRGWNADFLTPTPVGEGEQGFEEELARVRETPAEVARADLAVSLGGSLPAGLRRSDLPERAAGLLEWVWREAVLPYWSRRRGSSRPMWSRGRGSWVRVAGSRRWRTCVWGCAGWERAGCRSTPMITRRWICPGRG
ncbi:hypothetical protein ACFQX6_10535 [Streptosporangium lutulentum]